MRIAIVHNRYQQQGGEDAVFEAEASLLERHGHEVTRVLFDNRDLAAEASLRQNATLALTTVWSRQARARLRDVVERVRPDVVHFHNTFPLVSPAAYAVCRQAGAAVVQTLHNYRLLCPSGTLFRDGKPCEDCMDRTLLAGVRHGCYRDSRAQTAVVATMLTLHRVRATWRDDVDLYIALTDFARNKLVQGGLPPDRVVVKPNFVDPPTLADPGPRDGFLYVGRLAPEKGVGTLLDAWQSLPRQHLTLIGSGPLDGWARDRARHVPGVTLHGHLAREGVYQHMRASRALVFPSLWYETFGMVAVEAFAQGTPVIAARIGGIPELVRHGETGLLFEPGNGRALASSVEWAAEHPEAMRRMGERARREYEQWFSPASNYRQLMAIYRHAIATASGRGDDATPPSESRATSR